MKGGSRTKTAITRVPFLITPGGGPGILPEISALRRSHRIDAKIILADANAAVGNLYLPEVDAVYRLPPCSDAEFIPSLLRLIEREDIRYMYSGLDEELPILSRNRDAMEALGCKILVPPPEALECALDKLSMWERLHGKIPMPRTFALDVDLDPDAVYQALDGRAVIKVADWRGGRLIFIPEDREEFDVFIRRARRIATETGRRFLVQRFLSGTEFNVTTLHDRDCRVVYAVCRRKFEDRLIKSTTTAAVIERRDDVIEVALKTLEHLGLMPGFNNVEIIVDAADKLPYLLEVNGGRTAAQDENIVAAGINIAELLIDILDGRAVQSVPHPADGLCSLKIRRDVIVPMQRIEDVPLP